MKVLVAALLAASTAAFADEPPDGTLTLPEGAVAVAGVVSATTRDTPARPPATQGVHDTTESLALAVAAGITSDITAGVTYAADLHDSTGSFPSGGRWRGPLLAHGELQLRRGPRAFVAVGGDVVVHLENSKDRAVHVGVGAGLRLSPSLLVFTGQPLPNGPVGQQLAIQLASNHSISLSVPVGLLVRPELPVYGFVETTLARIAISNATNQLVVADAIPVDAGVFFRASPELDLGVLFSDDLENAGAYYTIGVTARFCSR